MLYLDVFQNTLQTLDSEIHTGVYINAEVFIYQCLLVNFGK